MGMELAQQIATFGKPTEEVLSDVLHRRDRARGCVLSSPATLRTMLGTLEERAAHEPLRQYCNVLKFVIDLCLSAVPPPPASSAAGQMLRSDGSLSLLVTDGLLHLSVMGLLSDLQEVVLLADAPERMRTASTTIDRYESLLALWLQWETQSHVWSLGHSKLVPVE